jgi:hypothetical protein
MAPATKYTCTALVWSYVFGFGSGVGGMIWLLLKLLRFQRAEVKTRVMVATSATCQLADVCARLLLMVYTDRTKLCVAALAAQTC